MHTTSNETTQTSNMTSSSANSSDCCRSDLASSSARETASACAPGGCGICDKSCRLESANPSGDGAESPMTHGVDPCFAT